MCGFNFNWAVRGGPQGEMTSEQLWGIREKVYQAQRRAFGDIFSPWSSLLVQSANHLDLLEITT